MKSLQLAVGACAVFLSVAPAFAAPPLFPGSTPTAPATPSPEVQALVNEGIAAYQKGDIEGAKRAFDMAYSMDSRNIVAINYLRRLKAEEGTARKTVDQEKQLAAVVVDVQFREATLSSALDSFKRTVASKTNGRLAVSIVVQLPQEVVNSQNVTLSLKNIPATEALRYLADQVNAVVAYDKYAIVIKPKSGSVVPTTSTTTGTPAQ